MLPCKDPMRPRDVLGEHGPPAARRQVVKDLAQRLPRWFLMSWDENFEKKIQK